MEGFNSQQEDEDSVNILLLPVYFSRAFILYLAFKLRQWLVFAYAGISAFIISMTNLKSWSVRKMFWGRSSFYKTAIHFFVGSFTLVITLSGISSRLDIFQNENQGIVLAAGVAGSYDLILQKGTAESIVPSDPNQLGYQVRKHVVQRGETIGKIAQDYELKEDTIRWANGMPAGASGLSVGQVLDIPEIDGVLYTVKKGDSVKKIASITKGNEIDIIELNNLDFENPIITEGQRLFVPNGSIEPPRPVVASGGGSRNPSFSTGTVPNFNVPSGTFIRPLPPGCGKWSRGFTYYHGGVDIAQPGGCWIRAAGAGRVVEAGFRGAGQGFMVEIDHGSINGRNVHTRYYHGNGSYRVRPGDLVVAGQDIMHMGCSGRCYGTHLHFEVVVNGVKDNPEKHVPGLR